MATSVGVLMASAVVAAQTQPADNFVVPTAEDFARESLPATPFVFVAYAVVWLLLFGYVFLIWRRLGRMERELADVHTRLRTTAKT
jgi:CcmD family protein